MSQLKLNNATDSETADSHWRSLYKVGGVAALIVLVLIVIQAIVFIVWPPLGFVIGYFTLFQNNWFLGLLRFGLLHIIINTVLILIYLSLYAALKRASESLMAIALTLGLVGIVTYLARNTAFEMLHLSSQYAAATTDAQRAMLLGAGQAMLTIYQDCLYDMHYLLNVVALWIISAVMLRSKIFSKATACVGFIAGTVSPYLSLLSLVPWAIFLVLIARRLFQLGRGTSKGVSICSM